MNINTRIELTDSTITATTKLSEGNPGAVTVCIKLLKEGGEIDPDNLLGGLGCLLSLDSHAIYGASIWMLYKDVCGEDTVKVVALLRAVQLGILEEDKLIYAIGNYGEGIDVDNLYTLVKERLPTFDTHEV